MTNLRNAKPLILKQFIFETRRLLINLVKKTIGITLYHQYAKVPSSEVLKSTTIQKIQIPYFSHIGNFSSNSHFQKCDSLDNLEQAGQPCKELKTKFAVKKQIWRGKALRIGFYCNNLSIPQNRILISCPQLCNFKIGGYSGTYTSKLKKNMKKYNIVYFVWVLAGIPFTARAQQTIVSVDLKSKKSIGGISFLDRNKYFNLHSSYVSWDLNDQGHILNDLQIDHGRAFSGPGSSNPNVSNGKITKYPSSEEGRAIGKNADQQRLLKYYELMNEPFVHINDFAPISKREEIVEQMSLLWKKTAEHLHQEIPNTLVGGYSGAWAEPEFNNFQHWHSDMKPFMDIAGSSMDFLSTHLYDGATKKGENINRTGCNTEAILDLIDAYSHQKWGAVKPQVISEFGKAVRAWLKDSLNLKEPKPYSPQRDGEILRSINAFVLQFMSRPDRILKTIPCIVTKGKFYYEGSRNPNQYPYPWVLMRKLNDDSYAFTHLFKFYEFWKGIQGNRTFISASDPDILKQSFLDGNKAFVILHSLEETEKWISIKFLNDSGADIHRFRIRKLHQDTNGIPLLESEESNALPDSLSLTPGATVVIECHLSKLLSPERTLQVNNYYAPQLLTPIVASTEHLLTINDVVIREGTATLRLGLGHDHGASLHPTLKINGTNVPVPRDWMGYNQAIRKRFFGTTGIPIQSCLLKRDNEISVTFEDGGGHISTTTLEAENTINSQPEEDALSLNMAPTLLYKDSLNINVTVPYSAGDCKEMALKLFKGNKVVLSKIATLGAEDSLVFDFSLNSPLEEGGNYRWRAHIRPIGSGFDQATAKAEQKGVLVTSVLNGDSISLSKAPLYVPSKTSYTVEVDYLADGPKELVLGFWQNGQWIGSTKTLLRPGKGSRSMTVELSSTPTAGNDYYWQSHLRPLGSLWKDRSAQAKSALVTVHEGNLLKNPKFSTGDFSDWTKSFGETTILQGQGMEGYGASIQGVGSISQVVKGLLPNTEYILSVYTKVSAIGEIGKLGVKDYGRDEISNTITNTDFEQISLRFTTGDSTTIAQPYLFVPSMGYMLMADNFELKEASNSWARSESSMSNTDQPYEIYWKNTGQFHIKINRGKALEKFAVYDTFGRRLEHSIEMNSNIAIITLPHDFKVVLIKLNIGGLEYIKKMIQK